MAVTQTHSKAWANQFCFTQEQLAMLNDRIHQTISDSFPELVSTSIELDCLSSQQDFLSIAPRARTLFGKKRVYALRINPHIFVEPALSHLALRAILAHELSHVVDYEKKSAAALILLGLRYQGSRTFRRSFERATDVVTLERGYGHGLIEFREWLYLRLSDSAAVRRKKQTYMTPDEIIEWMLNH